MNNHFQSSETAWMVTGLTSESSGRYGSSLWVLSQVIQPRIAMITQGTSQTTASMRLEWCQSGLYSAWVFEARYFQANARVITITGMTTISISRVAVMIRVRSSMPTCPFGLNRVMSQPPSSSAGARESHFNAANGFALVIFRP